MTVQELIDILSEIDPDLEVYADNGFYPDRITTVQKMILVSDGDDFSPDVVDPSDEAILEDVGSDYQLAVAYID